MKAVRRGRFGSVRGWSASPALALGLALIASAGYPALAAGGDLPEAPPRRPAPVRLVAATPFTLSEPLLLDARVPRLRAGSLIVVETSPRQLEPRQSNDWLIRVDGVAVQCLNNGYPSGRLVCLVPGVTEWRTQTLALEDAPGRLHADRERATDRLREGRIGRRPRAELDAARRRGGEPRVGLGLDEFRRWIASAIRSHAPGETDRAEALTRSPLGLPGGG